MGRYKWYKRDILFGIDKKRIISLSMLFVFFFILSSFIVNIDDDNIYADAINVYGSFFKWIEWFSENWGGRVIPQGILVLILQYPPYIFHILNAIFWLILVVYIEKIYNYEQKSGKYFYYCFILAIITFIPTNVLNYSVFWKCANVLYLWGMAALMVAIYPSLLSFVGKGKQIKQRDYAFSIMAIIYTAGIEQAAALMCGLMIFFFLFTEDENRYKSHILFVSIFIAIVSTVYFCFILKGNATRSHIEILGHMANYDMYSFVDKILWGITYTVKSIEDEFIVPVFIICSLVFYQANKSGRRVRLLFSVILFLYFGLNLLYRFGVANTYNTSALHLDVLFRMIEIDSISFDVGIKRLLVTFIHIDMYILLGCMLISTSDDRFDALSFITFFGALGTSAIMGFSPTIYASGARTRFICYLLLLCVLFRKIIITYDVKYVAGDKSNLNK